MGKVVAVFTILGAIAAIVAVVQQGCWHSAPAVFPPSTPVQVEGLKPPAPQPSTQAEIVTPEFHRHQAQDPGTTAEAGVEPADRQEFRPLEFSLSNGEQKVLLAGQASVGVEFNHVGEMDFVTVRINSPGKEPEAHAALSTGARFDLAAGGKEYYVSILSVDQEARRVKLSIDQKE